MPENAIGGRGATGRQRVSTPTIFWAYRRRRQRCRSFPRCCSSSSSLPPRCSSGALALSPRPSAGRVWWPLLGFLDVWFQCQIVSCLSFLPLPPLRFLRNFLFLYFCSCSSIFLWGGAAQSGHLRMLPAPPMPKERRSFMLGYPLRVYAYFRDEMCALRDSRCRGSSVQVL